MDSDNYKVKFALTKIHPEVALTAFFLLTKLFSKPTSTPTHNFIGLLLAIFSFNLKEDIKSKNIVNELYIIKLKPHRQSYNQPQLILCGKIYSDGFSEANLSGAGIDARAQRLRNINNDL